MTLHLLSFKSPETQYFEKQMDANEKLNTIKHNQIEQQLNELKNEQNPVYNNKKIYDHIDEKLHAQNYVLPEKLKLNEIQFTSEEYDNVIFNSKFIFDIQQNITECSSQLQKIQEQHKTSLTNQRKEIINELTNFIQNHRYENLKVENLNFKNGMILNAFEIDKLLNSLQHIKTETIKNVIQLLYNKGLFDNFPNKDQVFEQYLSFSEQYLNEKYTSNIETSDGLYYISDLSYSESRNNILKCLKKDKVTDIVYLRHHLKLTDDEINFVLIFLIKKEVQKFLFYFLEIIMKNKSTKVLILFS